MISSSPAHFCRLRRQTARLLTTSGRIKRTEGWGSVTSLMRHPVTKLGEATRHLRRLPGLEKARIYAVSGVTGAAHERRCGESGFTGQLSKPVDPGSFVHLL